MNTSESTVFVVDDDPPVLKAISRLLRAARFNVVAYSSPRRFLDHYDPRTPGCLVLDLAMPELSGLELQQILNGTGESLPIVFLTGRGDVPASVKAMKQGAVDFLTKPVMRDTLVSAVQAALARDRAARTVQREVDAILSRVSTLTPREYQVFEHVISGKLNKQTAVEIGAAEKTIKVHRGRVMEKMQVQSVAELVRLAERAGITVTSTETVSV